MPGMLDETRHIMACLAGELPPDTSVNGMGRHDPPGVVSPERAELEEAVWIAREAGPWRLDQRGPGLRLLRA